MEGLGLEALQSSTHVSTKRDSFTEILKKMKETKVGEVAAAKAETDGDEDGERITFDDYERLMQRMEKEKNWAQI